MPAASATEPLITSVTRIFVTIGLRKNPSPSTWVAKPSLWPEVGLVEARTNKRIKTNAVRWATLTLIGISLPSLESFSPQSQSDDHVSPASWLLRSLPHV